MTTCARCGQELGVGRFCLNCGHPVGEPVPVDDAYSRPPVDSREPSDDREHGTALPAWAPWAAGGVAGVLLLVLLVTLLTGGDDDEATDPAPADGSTTQTTAPEVTPPTKPRNLTGALRATDAPPESPPSTDLDGSSVDYVAANMTDGQPATAWRTAGDATGAEITFTLRQPSVIRRVGLINGYAKQVPNGTTLVDWYPFNRRITAVEWVFDDGTVVRQDLAERRRLQRIKVDDISTQTIVLRLVSVTEPGTGTLARDYTTISDVNVWGSN